MEIIEAVAFLQYLYELTNLSPWHLNYQNWSYERSFLLKIYTILILLGSSCVMFYSFLTENDFTKTSVNEIGQTVDFIQMFGIRLAHIVSVMEALLMKQEQRRFHECVQEIDKIFQCKLNVHINNRKFRQWILQRAFTMSLIYLIADFTMLTTKILTAKHDFFLFWFFYIMPMMICGLRYFQMFTCIVIVQQRLKQLIQILNDMKLLARAAEAATTTSPMKLFNNKLENISRNTTILSTISDNITPTSGPTFALANTCNNLEKKAEQHISLAIHSIYHNSYPTTPTAKPKPQTTPHLLLNHQMITQPTPAAIPSSQINDNNFEIEKLLIIRDLYNRLYHLTKIINRYFGLSMLINVGNDFISITSNCYWIFINFKQYSSTTTALLQTICSAAWSVPHLLNILILVVICERTVHCTTDLALMLHGLENDYTNDRYNSMVTQFSLQLLHQKITLTAAGFFNIDCTVLYTIVGATTTYLIILIQFHLNENKPIS